MDDNAKISWKDKLLPSLVLFLTMCVIMGGFYGIKALNTTQIQPVVDIAGEETDPGIGRLICCAVYFILAITLVCIAIKQWAKSKDRMLLTWGLASAGGTLLWVSVGECLWHFGMKTLTEKGEVTFVNFCRIECIQGVSLFVLSVLFTVAVFRKAGFPLLSFVLTFLGNWFGHIYLLAVYPVHRTFGASVGIETFYRLSGAIHTVIFAVLGLWLILGKTKKETKYYASVLIYLALGSLLFAVILCET